jgi:hypothetical protein
MFAKWKRWQQSGQIYFLGHRTRGLPRMPTPPEIPTRLPLTSEQKLSALAAIYGHH